MTDQVRLGMLTPSSNTVLEPVTSAMVAALPGTTAHFSRFTVKRISLEEQALGQFDHKPMLAAADLLADARVNVISWNGTSASWLGLRSDEDLVARIEGETGLPASTCVLSLVEAMRAIGAKSYALVTPYTQNVQTKIVDNFSRLDFICTAEEHFDISDNFSFGLVGRDRVAAAIRSTANTRPDAVVVLCTNLVGAPLARELEEETCIPVFDSISVTVWGALRRLGRSTEALAPWGPRLASI